MKSFGIKLHSSFVIKEDKEKNFPLGMNSSNSDSVITVM